MCTTLVPLAPIALYDRPTFDGMRPLPDGYTLDRVAFVRADQVRPGDLVVGDASSRVTREDAGLRWVGWLAAPYVAQPAPYDADCASCRAWMSGVEGPMVLLYPHVPARADEVLAVVPALVPVDAAPATCVRTCRCEEGWLPNESRWAPRTVCGDCHRRLCSGCAAGGNH